MDKPKPRLTEAQWLILETAFREDPGNYVLAAKKAGIYGNTAKKAWEKGWPSYGDWGRRPIKEILKDEQLIARGMLEELNQSIQKKKIQVGGKAEEIITLAEEQARAKLLSTERACEAKLQQAEQLARQRISELHAAAKIDQIEARVERSIMIRESRKNAATLLNLVLLLYEDYRQLAQRVRDSLDTMTPKEVLGYVSALSRLTRDATEAATMALALEDRELGKPDIKIAVEHMDLKEQMDAIDEAKNLADLIRGSNN